MPTPDSQSQPDSTAKSPKNTGGPSSARLGPVALFLTVIERLGNFLPHPVTLFALLTALIMVVSAIAAAAGLSVADPRPGADPDATFEVTSLLNGDGIRWLSQNLVRNFTGFVPLGTVLVALLGVGIAEKSGLLSAAVRALVLAAPKQLVTVVVVFAGVLSNTASEMGYVVLIPLAMSIFHSLGRHPLAGLAASFAGVSGGYSANLVLGTVDPLLAGITQEAARMLAPEYEVNPACNWFFMAASVVLITAIGWFITAKIVEPRLGVYNPEDAEEGIGASPSLNAVTPIEKRGLLVAAACIALLVVALVLAAGPRWLAWMDWLPGFALLRDPDPGLSGVDALRPLLRSVVPIIFIFFGIPGVVYGAIVGTMRGEKAVINAMAEAMRTMGLYIVLVFFAAQFVACFDHSGLGQILAVLGADALIAMKMDGPIVFIPFILMCCMVNLLLGSASAQWAVTAPIFVPMLMQVGYSPEVIQAAYRIGDSTTNIITPMMSYFGLILAVAARYQRNMGIGTLVSTMLPYSIAFLIGWMALFYMWVFVLGLPVGPGSPTHYTPGV
ncbi:MAG: AbgT family transporter [Phycisphaeraceae bacterium]|nr:AbgT family transporter [Phycisphaeraceae bacterium]